MKKDILFSLLIIVLFFSLHYYLNFGTDLVPSVPLPIFEIIYTFVLFSFGLILSSLIRSSNKPSLKLGFVFLVVSTIQMLLSASFILYAKYQIDFSTKVLFAHFFPPFCIVLILEANLAIRLLINKN